jgi:rhodanese-related sulfurtransferase
VSIAVPVVLLLVLTGCGGGNDNDAEAPSADVATSVTSPVVEVVNATEFAAVVDESGVTVIDVRTPEEFAVSRLENAALFDIASPDFIEMISTLDSSGGYAVYCRSGNRSAVATAAMQDLGFTDVVELGGGIVEWEAAGYPTVSG